MTVMKGLSLMAFFLLSACGQSLASRDCGDFRDQIISAWKGIKGASNVTTLSRSQEALECRVDAVLADRSSQSLRYTITLGPERAIQLNYDEPSEARIDAAVARANHDYEVRQMADGLDRAVNE